MIQMSIAKLQAKPQRRPNKSNNVTRKTVSVDDLCGISPVQPNERIIVFHSILFWSTLLFRQISRAMLNQSAYSARWLRVTSQMPIYIYTSTTLELVVLQPKTDDPIFSRYSRKEKGSVHKAHTHCIFASSLFRLSSSICLKLDGLRGGWLRRSTRIFVTETRSKKRHIFRTGKNAVFCEFIGMRLGAQPMINVSVLGLVVVCACSLTCESPSIV